jgi:hypothetical protein
MKRIIITLLLLAFAFVASAQYNPGKPVLGNLNVYKNLWVKDTAQIRYVSADTLVAPLGYITTIYNTLIATNHVTADSIVTVDLVADTIRAQYAVGDTTVATTGFITTIYNTTISSNDVITEDVHASDTIVLGSLTIVNHSDTLAYGDSILICSAHYAPNVWVAVDTAGIPIGKADIVIGSNGALAQVYTPYGCIVVGSLTAGKICIRKWGTKVYIRNNRWKSQRITYEIKTL